MKDSVFSKNNTYLILLAAILSIGIFFRLFHYNTIPFGLNHDGGLFGLVAIDLWKKLPWWTPFYYGWVGETMYHYWLGFLFHVQGISVSTLRLACTLIGVFTLPAFYFLAKKIQGKKTALLSLFFLCISGWHITMGKSGWSVILVPLFQSLALTSVLVAMERNKVIYWIASGIVTALTIYTYGAARVVPLSVFVIIVAVLINHHKKRLLTWRYVAVFLAAFVVTTLPMIHFAATNPETFTSRMKSLSVVNRIQETKSLSPLFENVLISAAMLHHKANGDDFFVNEPLLEFIPGILFLIGIVWILYQKNKKTFFILSTLFIGFIPGIISVPNGNHDFSILVPVYLIIGEGAVALFLLLKRIYIKTTVTRGIIVVVMCILSVADMYHQFFSLERREIFGFYPETTIVAEYMNKYKEDYDFYLTDNYPRDALTFMTYKRGNPFEKHYIWYEDGQSFLITANPSSKKGFMFFMFANEQNESIAQGLLNRFPNAEKKYLWYKDGRIKRKSSLVVLVPPTN